MGFQIDRCKSFQYNDGMPSKLLGNGAELE